MRTMRAAAVSILVLFALLCGSARAVEPAAEDVAAVKDVHKKWLEALTKADTAAVEVLLVDDYVLTDPGGKPKPRSEIVSDLKDKELKLDTADAQDVVIRIYGNAAVITCREHIKGKHGDNEVDGKFIVTDVLVKRDGKWRLVAGHMMRASEE